MNKEEAERLNKMIDDLVQELDKVGGLEELRHKAELIRPEYRADLLGLDLRPDNLKKRDRLLEWFPDWGDSRLWFLYLYPLNWLAGIVYSLPDWAVDWIPLRKED